MFAVVRGQIWEYVGRDDVRRRALVITNPDYNVSDEARPWALLVQHASRPPQGHYILTLDRLSPRASYVDVAAVVRICPDDLREMIGFVDIRTVLAIEALLRELLDLPYFTID